MNSFAEALQGELGEQGSSAATAEGGGEPGGDPGLGTEGPGTGNEETEKKEEGENKKTSSPSGGTSDKQ